MEDGKRGGSRKTPGPDTCIQVTKGSLCVCVCVRVCVHVFGGLCSSCPLVEVGLICVQESDMRASVSRACARVCVCVCVCVCV